MDNNNKISLQEAVSVIANALRRDFISEPTKDRGFFSEWRDQIAACIKNRIRNLSDRGDVVFVIRKDQLDDIARSSANMFLKNLINTGGKIDVAPPAPQKFQTQPDTVEAIQWLGNNEVRIGEFMEGRFLQVEKPHPILECSRTFGNTDYKLAFSNTNGMTIAHRGDWIVRKSNPKSACAVHSYTFEVVGQLEFAKKYRPKEVEQPSVRQNDNIRGR